MVGMVVLEAAFTLVATEILLRYSVSAIPVCTAQEMGGTAQAGSVMARMAATSSLPFPSEPRYGTIPRDSASPTLPRMDKESCLPMEGAEGGATRVLHRRPTSFPF